MIEKASLGPRLCPLFLGKPTPEPFVTKEDWPPLHITQLDDCIKKGAGEISKFCPLRERQFCQFPDKLKRISWWHCHPSSVTGSLTYPSDGGYFLLIWGCPLPFTPKYLRTHCRAIILRRAVGCYHRLFAKEKTKVLKKSSWGYVAPTGRTRSAHPQLCARCGAVYASRLQTGIEEPSRKHQASPSA